MFFRANYVAICKFQELRGLQKQPVRGRYERNRKDGEKEQCTGRNHFSITPAKLRCEWLIAFIGRTIFDFLVRVENTTSCIYARRYAGSSQLSLFAGVVAF